MRLRTVLRISNCIVFFTISALDTALFCTSLLQRIWPWFVQLLWLSRLALALAPYRGAIHAAAFVLVLSSTAVQGFLSWRSMQDSFMAHWTRDTELFFWRQRPISAWKADYLVGIRSLYGDLMPLVFLVLPIYFVLDWRPAHHFLWLGGATLLPALSVGMISINSLACRFYTESVTILDTGVIHIGLFFPWESISWFEMDEREGFVRLYARTPPRPVLAVLQPPEEIAGEVLSVLGEHLPSSPPREPVVWSRGKDAWVIWATGFFLLGCVWALFPYFIPNRNVACIPLMIGFWFWSWLFVRLTERLLGIQLVEPGEGLERGGE